MVKLYYKEPVKTVLTVKPDKESDEYSVWVLVPKCVGHVTKAGDKRMDANGRHYTNLNSAVRALLEDSGDTDLLDEVDPYMRRTTERLELTGADILERDPVAWKKFCGLKKMKVSDMKALQKKYALTQDEAKELGLV